MAVLSYENWILNSTLQARLSTDRLAEMFAATCRYGSGNDWTGTSGELCKMIRELLQEVERLKMQSVTVPSSVTPLTPRKDSPP